MKMKQMQTTGIKRATGLEIFIELILGRGGAIRATQKPM
jgi:hypothetical protein